MAAETVRDDARNETFRALLYPEVGMLYSVALRLTRSPQDAEDVVQETLLRAYRALDSFDGRYPRAWLLTILRNVNINRTRRRRPELMRDEERTLAVLPADGADGREGPAEIADRIPDQVVVDAVRSLPPGQQDVIALVDIEGLSYRETAQFLDIPLGTVMSRLHRARRKLRTRLERAGYGEGTPDEV